MAKRSSSSLFNSPFSLFLPIRDNARLYLFALLSIFSLLLHHLSAAAAHSDFEGFDADEDEDFAHGNPISEEFIPPLRSSPPPISLSTPTPESHRAPPAHDSDQSQIQSPPSDQNPNPGSFVYWDEDEFEGIPQNLILSPESHRASPAHDSDQSQIQSPPSDQNPNPGSFVYWDEDEFEGIPQNLILSPENQVTPDSTSAGSESDSSSNNNTEKDLHSDSKVPKKLGSYSIEIACVSFLIMFTINYFTGNKENENLALAWASKFATKGSIFDRNFSLLGVSETEDSPLLLQEGRNVFKFYASGRRFCTGLLATMELKSRHDLISRLYNMVVPCKDEMTFEVYMNDDAMDHVVFALARKKLAKTMQKEVRDLQRFAGLVNPPNGRKWVPEELQVVSESKEVAGDLITDAVLDQVFGDKANEKFGKGFISMHFSDQYLGSNKKMLVFKFALPSMNHMADMARLVALVPYYIDLIGKYKLSSQARSKTEAARSKVAQEMYKELQNARQDAMQKKKAEQRRKLEEAEAKLSAEALRRKEAKERARQMKKAMPKMKMTKGH